MSANNDYRLTIIVNPELYQLLNQVAESDYEGDISKFIKATLIESLRNSGIIVNDEQEVRCWGYLP